MPLPTVDQTLKFVKEFGLAVVIMGVGLYYLSNLVEAQRVESSENKNYVRTELKTMNETTATALANSNKAIESNTAALERQFDISHVLTSSVVRQEETLESIDEAIRETCAANKKFSEQVAKDHPIQIEKLDQIISQTKE